MSKTRLSTGNISRAFLRRVCSACCLPFITDKRQRKHGILRKLSSAKPREEPLLRNLKNTRKIYIRASHFSLEYASEVKGQISPQPAADSF
ncbi:uncharacterized [Tachysurus ichikawai]